MASFGLAMILSSLILESLGLPSQHCLISFDAEISFPKPNATVEIFNGTQQIPFSTVAGFSALVGLSVRQSLVSVLHKHGG